MFCWSWNLESRLIRIYKFDSDFHFILFYNENTPFGLIGAKKIKIVSFIWNLTPRLFRKCKIWWWYSFFCFRPFFASFVQNLTKPVTFLVLGIGISLIVAVIRIAKLPALSFRWLFRILRIPFLEKTQFLQLRAKNAKLHGLRTLPKTSGSQVPCLSHDVVSLMWFCHRQIKNWWAKCSLFWSMQIKV